MNLRRFPAVDNADDVVDIYLNIERILAITPYPEDRRQCLVYINVEPDVVYRVDMTQADAVGYVL